MSLRLSGINPLSYMGVEPYTPPSLIVRTTTPTPNDSQNYNIGTFWLIADPQELWYLASLAQNTALWIQLYPAGGGGGGASEFITDVGTANEVAGILNVLGDGRVTTSGAGNTVSLHLAGSVPNLFDADIGSATPSGGTLVIAGGTNMNTSGAGDTITVNLDNNVTLSGGMVVGTNLVVGNNVTLVSHIDGVLQTDGAGLVSATNGTNGQVLIGGGTAPVWANLTSSGGTVIITNGANTINLEAEGGGGGGGTPIAFFGYQNIDATIPNSSVGQPNAYLLGSSVALTSTLNAGGGFNPGDGVGTPASFTAPVTGKYFLHSGVLVSTGFGSGSNTVSNASIAIINPEYPNGIGQTFYNPSGAGLIWSGQSVSASIVTNMTAGDIATFRVTNTAGGPGIVNWTVSGEETPGAPITVFPATYVEGFLISQTAVTPGSALSFYAYQLTDYDVPPAPTPGYSRVAYKLGSASVLTTIYNAGGAFYPGDGVGTASAFTAPVRGRYFFSLTTSILPGFDGNNNQITLDSYSVIAAPTFNYVGYSGQPRSSVQVASWQECLATCEATVELDVNDQVTFQIYGPAIVVGSPVGRYTYRVVGDSPETVYPYDAIGVTRDLYPTSVKGWIIEEF